MKKIYLTFIFLCVALFVQIQFAEYSIWLPDLIILAVIFAAIFNDLEEGILVGFVAGLLRSALSIWTLPVDIIFFPAIAFFSSLVSRMLYRHNPIVHMLLAFLSISGLISFHVIYLSSISGNDLGLAVVFGKSWRTIITTVLAAPALFLTINWLQEKYGIR